MSIASQLTALEGNISDAYNMVAQRGGTVPARKNMENLDDAIATIPSGGSFIGIPREVSSGGMYRMPADNFTFSLPANVTSIGPSALYYAFIGCTGLTSVDLSSLTTVPSSNALSYAFYNCTGLTSADLSSLTRVTGSSGLANAFIGCTSLTSVDLSSLTTLIGSNALYSAFYGCTRLTSVDLSSLTGVTGPNALSYAFRDCTSLTSVSFPALTTVSGKSAFNYAFQSCSSLTSVSFPALTTSSFGTATNQFNNMLTKVRGCTVHFPAAIQGKIEAMTGYPNFGGTNTTVLFDL